MQANVGEVKVIKKDGQFSEECELEVRMEKMEGKMEVLGKKRNLKEREK